MSDFEELVDVEGADDGGWLDGLRLAGAPVRNERTVVAKVT